jgi:hypothetical protein
VRSITLAALGLSFATHVAVGAALLWPRPAAEVPASPAPQLAGETFELPAPETAERPLANAAPSPDTEALPAPELGDAPARPTPPSRARSAAQPSHQGRPSAGKASSGEPEGTAGGSGANALFGAVGDRSAADLATAFTRGFPQAASGDPSWRQAALGPAGEATVTLTLDAEGHLTDVVVSGAPSAPLSAGIRRTMALIKGRPFVARSQTTKLVLSATISSDTVHDGLHGDVFAIGGSFASSEGSAFFALAIGRRIDVRVRLR